MNLKLSRIESKSHFDLFRLSNNGQQIKSSPLNKITISNPLTNGKKFGSSANLFSSLTNLNDYKCKKTIKSKNQIYKNYNVETKKITKHKDKIKDDDEENLWPKKAPITESYKRLIKENIQLEKSFKTLLERFNEAKEQSYSDLKEKDILKEEVNDLKRKIELLSIELQEARDQNELMEFRLLESEQCQIKTCINEMRKEIGVNTEFLDQEKNISVHLVKFAQSCSINQKQSSSLNKINQCLNNEQKTLNNTSNRKDVETISKINSNKEVAKSCTSLESLGLNLSVISEDEGLGDDGRRDQYSSPSSLSDEEIVHLNEKMDEEENNKNEVVFNQHVNTFPDNSNSEIKKYLKSTSFDVEKTLQQRINELIKERDNLTEQVLELEEAENDARLLSQKLQKQSETFVNQIECLQISLVKANQMIEENRCKIKTLQESELKLKTELMMSLISKSEKTSSNAKEALIKTEENNDQYNSLDHFKFRANYSHHSVDNKQNFNDLEMFISEDNLAPNFGSSFHVQNINYQMPFKKLQSKLGMPLCETIKPRKIEVIFKPNTDFVNPD